MKRGPWITLNNWVSSVDPAASMTSLSFIYPAEAAGLFRRRVSRDPCLPGGLAHAAVNDKLATFVELFFKLIVGDQRHDLADY